MQEFWKEVKMSDGKYMVSSLGNVMSVKHNIPKNSENKNEKGFYLKPTDNGTSIVVQLYIQGKSKVFRLHDLVATHFVENLNKYKYVTHKDGNYKHCSYENLVWVEFKHKTFKSNHDIQDTSDEQWKFIPNTNNLYKISSLGRVFSLKRGKFITPTMPNGGYYSFNISVNNKVRLGRIHRLVAEAFVPNPNKLPCVDHIDGDRTNNSSSNLKWCTQIQNVNNPNTKPKTKNNRKAYRKPIIQLKNDVVIETYESINKASIINGFSKSAIYRCCIGYANTHKGFSWKFL